MKIIRLVAALAAALLAISGSELRAQTPSDAGSGTLVQGIVINRATVNSSASITTGNAFQPVLTSNYGTATQRQSLTIQNNNTTDNCWVYVGPGSPTKGNSMLLLPGGAYARYWPFVPSDAVQATCQTAGDTIYVENQ